ncbi:MAG TPA: DUF222 domain-containing protein [Pseudonocardia sp.]|nr:DUF222 domain-containing protein [Pseudonocardia sp.]
MPEDDLDGVLERLLADADALDDLPPIDQMHDAGDEPEFTYGSCAPSGWLALDLDTATADPAQLTDHTLIEAIVGFDRLASWAAARQARLLAELARRRPTDQAPYSARWAGVGSEYAPDEVGVALRLARGTAVARVGLACRLLATLSDTHAAWEAGLIDTAKARAIDDATWMLSVEHARAVQERVLPRAAEQTLAQLKAALARAVIAVDPDGAEQRHREARRDRRVVITPEADGMASLWALLTATQAAGAFTWLTRLARGLDGDDPRSMDTRRADILAALLSGQLVGNPAPGAIGDEPGGEGEAHSSMAGERTEAEPTGGSDNADRTARDDSATGAGRPIHPVTPGKPLIQIVIPYSTLIGADDHPAELVGIGPIPASLARETAADAVWRRLVTDPLSGTLLDHGRTTYHPPAGLADHVKARDVHCRFHGCRRRAADAELDHVVAWSDGGTTSEPNLAAACSHHHRVKTYAGWRVKAHPDGSLTWATPTGHRHTKAPHDYRPDRPPATGSRPPPDPDSPQVPESASPARTPDDPGTDPPPF